MLDSILDLLPEPPRGNAAWTLCLSLFAFDLALWTVAIIPKLLG